MIPRRPAIETRRTRRTRRLFSDFYRKKNMPDEGRYLFGIAVIAFDDSAERRALLNRD
jgi:hypothetical protein